MKQEISKFLFNISVYALSVIATMIEIVFLYNPESFKDPYKVSFIIIIDFIVKLNLIYMIAYLIRLILFRIKIIVTKDKY